MGVASETPHSNGTTTIVQHAYRVGGCRRPMANTDTLTWHNKCKSDIMLLLRLTFHSTIPFKFFKKSWHLAKCSIISAVNHGMYWAMINSRLTFSCLNLVRILISRRVLWQYVWCSKGDIFLIATFVLVTLSLADLKLIKIYILVKHSFQSL